jgi:hypothetical protein
MAVVCGSCLCGAVAWEVAPPLEFTSHCHCGRCRKTHGTAFATFAVCQTDAFRLVRGAERIARFESSPGLFRPFCDRCGAVVPDGTPVNGLVGVPVGPLDGDPGVRPLAHIFVGSKAPWFEVCGTLPQFEAYPPGFDGAELAELPATARRDSGSPSGSCLCSRVAFSIEGPPLRCWNCHCSRCRKARAAAHATNLFVNADDLRFARGADALVSYKLPEARFFTQVFCSTCGSPMPRVDRERGFAVVPMGSLDVDPGLRPERHIFVASNAPWYDIPDTLPQHAEYPPAG